MASLPGAWRGAQGARSLVLLALATSPLPAQQAPAARPEEFARVDPYTRGQPSALARAGYVSFGPLPWSPGVGTREIEEALGEPRILWLETAHFRLGSTLASYRSGVDRIEDRKLAAELERLAKKFARFEPEKNRLDPWLRLHLFAQRCEEEYDEFQRRFGIREADFAEAEPALVEGGPPRGGGAFLGMDAKYTVLLTESNATLGRYLARFAAQSGDCNWRGHLGSQTLFLGQSAECLRTHGFELDAALHCAVAADLAANLLKGFRGYHESVPAWFSCGLATWFSRRIDERWTIYARGTTLLFGDDSWNWTPRVRALVGNGLAAPFAEMLSWPSWDAIEPQGHLLLGSRMDWMLSRREADLHRLLLELSETVLTREQQEAALLHAFGAAPPGLDARWRDFVLHSSPRK